jgi:hypothetical protein
MGPKKNKNKNNNKSSNFFLNKLIKTVEQIVINYGAIYGEYNRQSIIQSYASIKFNDFRKENKIKLNSFSDKDVHPETYEDRNMKIQKMDVIMSDESFDLFIAELDINKIFYDELLTIYDDDELSEIFNIDIIDNYSIAKYIKLKISLQKNSRKVRDEILDIIKESAGNNLFNDVIDNSIELNSILDNCNKIFDNIPSFELNIAITHDDLSIFDGLNVICNSTDFFCNSLIMGQNNSIFILKKYQDIYFEKLNKKKSLLNNLDMIQNIIQQIKQKEACAIAPIVSKRSIVEMEKLGFKTIVSDDTIFEMDNKCGETCVLCQEDIHSIDYCLKIKTCCQTYFHYHCVSDNIDKFTGNCFGCRTPYNLTKFKKSWNAIDNFYSVDE